MGCELILAPSFPQLENHLVDRVGNLCRSEPFLHKWILTPTSTLAEHIRLTLAHTSKDSVLTGVSVLPFSQFLRYLLKGRNNDIVPRYHPALDLLLFTLGKRVPRLAETTGPGGLDTDCLAFRPTFLDLADGGFGMEQRSLLEELASEASLTIVEQTVLNLYIGWLEALEAAGMDWEPLVHQELANRLNLAPEDCLGEGLNLSNAQLLVYGFYDFTDVNSQILIALSKQLKVTLYFPHASHPSFSFSNRVLQDLLDQLGDSVEEKTIPAIPDKTGAVTKFFIESFPEGTCLEKPRFLTVQKASGIRAELLSAAVQICKWLDEPGDPVDVNRIMILTPEPELYYEEAREVFSSFSIPLRVIDRVPFGEPEHRALLHLNTIWKSRGDAEWLLSHFRDFPGLLKRREIDLDEFEQKIRELPLSSGKTWVRLSELLKVSDQASSLLFSQPEIDLISEIAELWADRPETGYPIGQAAKIMSRICRDWLEDPAPLLPALQALEKMKELIPSMIIPDDLFGHLFSIPEGSRPESELSGKPGVVFSSMMRARGITADAVVFLGLCLGRFPTRVEEDPLLSDSSRQRLKRIARDVGHRLAVKSWAIDEMSLLFFLLNTSARHLHWVIPRTDESGKTVAPTPWVQHYLHQWEETSPCHTIPRGPAEQALYLLDLEPLKGSLLPPSYTALLTPGSLPPGETDTCRNGQIPSAALSEPQRLSVTALELLARCPYRFYATAIAGWQAVHPLIFNLEPDPLEWGRLIHRFFEVLFKPCLGKDITLKRFPMSGKQSIWNVGDLPIQFQLLPEPLQLALIRRLASIMQAYLSAVQSDDCGDGKILVQEIKIRRPLPGSESLTISGQIDRVDDRQGRVHIVDYKSGRKPWSSQKVQALALHLGYHLQPLLYPWLYQEKESLSSKPLFSYIFLGADPPKEVMVQGPAEGTRFLGSLVRLLREGTFIASSNELMSLWGLEAARPCTYCELNSLCRRFDWDSPSRNGKLFEAFARERFETITQTEQGKNNVA